MDITLADSLNRIQTILEYPAVAERGSLISIKTARAVKLQAPEQVLPANTAYAIQPAFQIEEIALAQ